MKKNFEKELNKLDIFFRKHEREKGKRLEKIFKKRNPKK